MSLNKTTLSLAVGANETLVATVKPADATDKKVTFESSAIATATVDNTGKVVGIKVGTATITVKTTNGKTATCAVTIT